MLREQGPERGRGDTPGFGQRHVGGAGVTACRAPLGLGMTDDPELVHPGIDQEVMPAAARRPSRKSGCAISASAAARSPTVRPRSSATPCSVITRSS